jgi:tetratricopeptide (TPR) repeat protein
MTRVRLAAICVALSCETGALADTNDGKAQALYDEAKGLVAQGNWAAACPKLLDSKRLSAEMKTIYRLAECYERVGKLGAAWRNYQEAAIAAAKAGETEKSRAAIERAAAIEPKIGKLRASSQAQADAELAIDDETIARPWADSALGLDPGEHTIEVRAAGKKPFHATVTIAAGKTATLAVPALETEAATLAPADNKPEAPGAATSTPTPLTTTVGWVLLGAGVVTTGVGGYLAFSASSKYHEADTECGTNGCNAAGFEATNDARRLGNVATFVFSAGVALAAGGVVLLILPRKEPTTVAFTGQGVFLRGSF